MGKMTELGDMVSFVVEHSLEDLRKTVEAFAMGLDGAPDRGAKWHRILDAATELFTQQGYRKTSVDEIAQRAEMS